MRKIITTLLIFALSFLLISCVPQDEQTKLLQKQYDDYILHDIRDDAHFDALINGVSNEVIPGVVVIKMTGKDVFNRVISTSVGTGFIYATYEASVKIITSAKVIEQKQTNLNYAIEFIDYANQSYTGQIKHVDENMGVAILEFSVHVSSTKLKKLTLATDSPRVNEPLLMISNYQGSRNSLLMGLLLNKDDESFSYETSIPYDAHSIGGTLMNMQHQVIGLLISYEDQEAYVINLDMLKQFLSTQ